MGLYEFVSLEVVISPKALSGSAHDALNPFHAALWVVIPHQMDTVCHRRARRQAVEFVTRAILAESTSHLDALRHKSRVEKLALDDLLCTAMDVLSHAVVADIDKHRSVFVFGVVLDLNNDLFIHEFLHVVGTVHVFCSNDLNVISRDFCISQFWRGLCAQIKTDFCVIRTDDAFVWDTTRH